MKLIDGFKNKEKWLAKEATEKVKCNENEKNMCEQLKEELEELKELEANKWVWVEGYKGMYEDMTAYGGFQYELNKIYTIEGEINSCTTLGKTNGFHFSLNMDDVFKYYKLMDNNRFFKVKGLVKQSELNKYGDVEYYFIDSLIIDKLVAKEIIIEEEITDEELFKLSKNFLNRWYSSKELTLEEFKMIKRIGITRFKANEFKKMFKELDLSDLLIEIIIEGKSDEQLEKLYKLGKALRVENVSNDIFIYLLLKNS